MPLFEPLVKVIKPNADVIEFIYNAEGTRTQKIVTPYEEQPVSTQEGDSHRQDSILPAERWLD